MKNFKSIILLMALIATSNACAAVTVLQKRIAAAVDKVAKNPNVELSADEKSLLSKHLNDNDININRLKSIEGFDMSQLGATSTAASVVESPVKTPAATAKPLTAAQKRAAARKEAAAAQLNPTPTTTPVNQELKQDNSNVAPVFYDAKTNSLKIDGVREYVAITRKAHPDMGNAQLIAKTYQNAVATLKPIVNPMVPAAITTFDALCRKLMTIIEDVVTKPLPSPEERSFALLYDAKTKALKADGVRKFVAITRKAHPDMGNAQLIATTYQNAVAILKATLNPMVPAAITAFDALCRKLMTMIEDIVNKPLPSPEERLFALLYDAKTKSLKTDGVREFVAITRNANPTLNNAQLIQKTYDDAVAILKTTLNPMVPAAIKIFDTLCSTLMTMIKNVVNKPLPALPQTQELVMNIKELEERLAKMEAELYYDELKERMAAMEAEVYYDKKTGLITADGIKNIVETIKSSAPAIDNKELIAAAYDKASELLKEIKKQSTLDTTTKNGLIRIVTHTANQYLITTAKLQPQELGRGKLVHKAALPLEPIERRARIGGSPDAPIFTSPLKELETIPLSEYHEIPKSFSSTIPEPLSDDVLQFIEKSKAEGIVPKTMGEDWLMRAIELILKGKLTNDNKQATLKKLFEVADIVVGAPLRNDTTISDDEYARLAGAIERRIGNFMRKLYVGAEYSPRIKPIKNTIK